MNAKLYKVIIVGAGPAGLTAAIFAQRKRLPVLLLDGGMAGGQLKNLYPNKPVYNYPGYANIKAADLAKKMKEQAEQEGISLMEDTPVHLISGMRNGNYELEVPGGVHYKSQSVILACGMGLFEPSRLNVPGESKLAENGIFYNVKNVEDWQDQNVVVIGGGNSALDNSIFLCGHARKVTIVHRLTHFQAEAVSVKQVKESSMELLMGWNVERFARENNQIVLYLKDKDGKKQDKIFADRVLINIGFKKSYSFLNTLPLARNKKGIIVDSEMKTTLPGVFACGDVVSYPGKVRLIVTAIGEAATAVNSVEEFLKVKN
jgi:thioredoxin reductase (NADPH)